MNTLPIELIHDIVSYVPDSHDKISLACASRCFQVPVEVYTFASIELKSFELFEFNHHFRYVHRRNALRNIRYTIRLPSYSVNSSRMFESIRTRRINNKAFTLAMVGLLQVLNSWEHDHDAYVKHYGAGVCLQLCEIYSESDYNHRNMLFAELEMERGRGLRQARYKHSYLRLVPVPLAEIWTTISLSGSMPYTYEEVGDPGEDSEMEKEHFVKTLPMVQSVTKFRVGCLSNTERKIEMETGVLLAGAMPNLQTLSMKGMRDDETRLPVVRQKMRLEFGLRLVNMCTFSHHFSNLQTLKLRLHSPNPCNHNYSVPANHPTYPATDYLSIGLHALSRLPNIKTLQLGMLGVWQTSISSSLFWPDSVEDKEAPPSWPSLQNFEVAFSPLAPAGTWYITGDPAAHSPVSPIYSGESESDADDSLPDRSVTPPVYHRQTQPAQAYVHPVAISDRIHPRREARLAGGLPLHPFRTILDPVTFTPLLLSVLKMISVSRQQNLNRLVLSMDLGTCLRHYGAPARGFRWMSMEGLIDFKLSFSRDGVGNLGPSSGQLPSLGRNELVILVGDKWKWEEIGEQVEVIKALSEAVGEDGVITVDPAFVSSGRQHRPQFLDSSDDDSDDHDSVVYLDDSDDDVVIDADENGSDDDDHNYDDYEDDDDYYDYADDEDITMRTRMKVRMTRRDWPR